MSIDNTTSDKQGKRYDKKISDYVNFMKFFVKIAVIGFDL